ncbi:MAG: hypothetical protein AAGD14_16890 [Planctomycetota bacterium]
MRYVVLLLVALLSTACSSGDSAPGAPQSLPAGAQEIEVGTVEQTVTLPVTRETTVTTAAGVTVRLAAGTKIRTVEGDEVTGPTRIRIDDGGGADRWTTDARVRGTVRISVADQEVVFDPPVAVELDLERYGDGSWSVYGYLGAGTPQEVFLGAATLRPITLDRFWVDRSGTVGLALAASSTRSLAQSAPLPHSVAANVPISGSAPRIKGIVAITRDTQQIVANGTFFADPIRPGDVRRFTVARPNGSDEWEVTATDNGDGTWQVQLASRYRNVFDIGVFVQRSDDPNDLEIEQVTAEGGCDGEFCDILDDVYVGYVEYRIFEGVEDIEEAFELYDALRARISTLLPLFFVSFVREPEAGAPQVVIRLFEAFPGTSEIPEVQDWETTPGNRILEVQLEEVVSRVVFARENLDTEDVSIFVREPGGERELSTPMFDASAPKWSPDKTKILFTGDVSGTRQLFVIDYPSAGARQVGNSPRNVTTYAWYPDSERIAYMTDVIGAGGRVETIRADGSDARFLLEVVSTAIRAGPTVCIHDEIYATDAGALLRVASEPEILTGVVSARYPVCAPFGRRIAYVNRARLVVRRLSDGMEVPLSDRAGSAVASWSRDGEWVTFADDDGILPGRADGS